MKVSVQFFFLLLAMFVLLPPWSSLSAAAEEPELRDIVVTTAGSDLLLSAVVHNAFPASMLQDLHKGRSVAFHCQVELVKVGSWFNSTLTELTLSHLLYYDQTRKLYQIILPYQQNRLHETADWAEAKKLMAEISGIRVIGLRQLVDDENYAIHIRVRIEEQTSDSRIQRLLIDSPDWETKIDWRTIEFRY